MSVTPARDATPRRRHVVVARKIGIAVGGGLILVAGVALIALPGPGWLVIVLGLWVLSFEFAWAERLFGRLRDKVVGAAHLSAANRWGTALSVLSACGIIAAGLVWALNDDLPYSSWATGLALSGSGVLALGTIWWSANDLKKKRARPAAQEN